MAVLTSKQRLSHKITPNFTSHVDWLFEGTLYPPCFYNQMLPIALIDALSSSNI